MLIFTPICGNVILGKDYKFHFVTPVSCENSIHSLKDTSRKSACFLLVKINEL